jgi:predicted RNA-binding protein
MCQSSVWLRYPDGHTEKIANDVLIVRQEGPVVVFGGIVAEPMRVTGTIQEIDAMKHTITLNVTGTDQEAIQAQVRSVEPLQATTGSHGHHEQGHE